MESASYRYSIAMYHSTIHSKTGERRNVYSQVLNEVIEIFKE